MCVHTVYCFTDGFIVLTCCGVCVCVRVALKGEEKEAAKKKALDLSLKFGFVTPLTSMVVTKPQEEETQVAHKPKEGAKPNKHYDMPVPHLTPYCK